MHRSTFFVTIALGLLACGDDTGGSGGSAGTGGAAGTGGDAASTTASTGSGEGGGDATTTISATVGSGGAGDFQSLIDACEELDTALNAAATEQGLACTIDSSCPGLPAQFPGCEPETEDLLRCQKEDFVAEDCVCDGEALDCGIFEICTDELNAFTDCRDSGG